MEKGNALIYIRVSTDDQADESRFSLPTQKSECLKALEAEGYILAEDGVYEDPGKTATNMNRPGLQDMLVRIEDDKSIKSVFVLDTDRLARNTQDHLTIKALLKKHGVVLVSVSQPGLQDTAEGNFMDIVISGVNQFQSQITARKVMKSMSQRFTEGWWATKAPIGYLNTRDPKNPEKKIITVDPIRGPLIAEIFKMYATGAYSMLEISDTIYRQGFTNAKGSQIALSLMFHIIENPFYYGEMHWAGLTNPKGNHSPLITREIYDQCQIIKENHNQNACRRRKHSFLLNGYLYTTTGTRFGGEIHTEKDKSYYRAKTKSENDFNQQDRCVNVNDIESEVMEKFGGIEFSEKFITKVEGRIQSIYEKNRKDVELKKISLSASKQNYERKLEVAEEKLISGVLTDDEFTKLKVRLRQQIALINGEIEKVEGSKNIKVDVIQKVLDLCRNIGEAYKKAPPELKRLYLGLFWDRFEVSNTKIVNAVPTRIIKALIQTGTICLNKRDKALPIEKMFSNKALARNNTVGISEFRCSQ